MSVAESDVAHWREWVGREERRVERLDIEAARRFAAALGEVLDIEATPPSLVHWALFLPVAPADGLGPDGHPKRGGFLPPITLPRRMFAAASMRFAAPLVLGEEAERISTIAAVTAKTGRSGSLVLVEVEHRILQAGAERVHERQTIVYRDAGKATPPVVDAALPAEPGDVEWRPGPVDLFSFSAVTFNSHRIHYDLPYATGEEGYPGLVVHGPFTACRLFGHARWGGRVPTRFAFRAGAPMFGGQTIRLRGAGEQVRAIRCDGADAMVADVGYD